MTWVGSGYTIIIDEVVSESPFVIELSYEKTDGTGALVSGPTAITQNDGVSRNWPRVAFSGTEYGITYIEGGTIVFERFDASLVAVPSSKVVLSTATGIAAVAWSGQAWGVAWGDGSLHFQRFDATGTALGPAVMLGAMGLTGISENGVPLIATSTGWAMVSNGYPATVYEIDFQGTMRQAALPFDASRASIASNGSLYAVAADSFTPLMDPAQFVFVQTGTSLTVGTPVTFGFHSDVANVLWNGTSFLVTWSETIAGNPQPLMMATVPPSMPPAQFFGTPFTTLSNAGFHQLAKGPCGWAVVYGTFTTNQFDELEVRP
jgi:hypothetical protein